MATFGTIKVPIYTKFDGEYQHIGEVLLNIEGQLVDGSITLSVDNVNADDSGRDSDPPPVKGLPVIDHGTWLWHKPIERLSTDPPVRRSFWRRGAVDGQD